MTHIIPVVSLLHEKLYIKITARCAPRMHKVENKQKRRNAGKFFTSIQSLHYAPQKKQWPRFCVCVCVRGDIDRIIHTEY